MCAGTWALSGKDPPCDTCEDREPDIMGENEALWLLLLTCESQMRVSMNGPFGLDWSVIIEAAKAWPVVIDQTFFRLVRAWERTMMAEINRKDGV